MTSRICTALCALFAASNLPLSRAAAGQGKSAAAKDRVQPRFSADDWALGPFPSDLFTIPDRSQNTGLHINLSTSGCEVLPPLPTECVENVLLNQLDGFHVLPRMTIAFSGPIDLSTVNSSNIFLVKLGNTLVNGSPPDYGAPVPDDEEESRLPADAGWVVGIDRAVWDRDTNTLYVKAEEILEQHTRYALIVTRGILDTHGDRIEQSKDFKRFRGDDGNEGAVLSPARLAYRRALHLALTAARLGAGQQPADVAIASVFSTMSVSAVLEKVRADIVAAPLPAPANFAIGPLPQGCTKEHEPFPGCVRARAVFDVNTITKLISNPQTNALQPPAPPAANAPNIPGLNTLKIVPPLQGATSWVRQIAFGSFVSRDYRNNRFRPPLATFSGVPKVQRFVTLFFTLFVPQGTQPAGGWPIVIVAQGSPDTMLGGPFNQAAKLASHGLAAIAINAVGFGFGPRSTITVNTMTVPAADLLPRPCDDSPQDCQAWGRSTDVDGNGTIANAEGAQAGPPKGLLLASQSILQSTIDYMQLVRVIEAGIDIDGNGTPDVDASRIYYAGSSNGALVGIPLFAVEPRVRAAVFTGVSPWPGLWMSPPNRGTFGPYFQNRQMLNPPGTPLVTSLGGVAVGPILYNENPPVPGAPPLVNEIAGALPMQQVEERADWLWNSNAPGAFAPYLRLAPLPGVRARPFIIFESRGDQNAVNPHTAELIRAGLFADRVTMYRHDRFPSKLLFKNPHPFIIRTDQVSPIMQNVALAAQEHLARFFKSDGADVLDPCTLVSCPATDGTGPLFEVPASFIPDVTCPQNLPGGGSRGCAPEKLMLDHGFTP